MSERNDDNAATQHATFLRDAREIDEAFRTGTLEQWVKGKVDEYNSRPADDRPADGEQVG